MKNLKKMNKEQEEINLSYQKDDEECLDYLDYFNNKKKEN